MSTSKTTFLALTEVLRGPARPLILRYARPDSCIYSTRVVSELLVGLGFQAVPVPVAVRVTSPALVSRLAAWRAAHPEDPDGPRAVEVARWTDEPGSRCWSVGVGYGPADGRPVPADKYRGHLIALGPGGLLVDLSIDQANRPKVGIRVAPVVGVASRAFWLGEEAAGFRTPDGCDVHYQRITDDGTWRTAPDWVRPGRTKAVVNELAGLVEQAAAAIRRRRLQTAAAAATENT
jgi:hypothetical protein